MFYHFSHDSQNIWYLFTFNLVETCLTSTLPKVNFIIKVFSKTVTVFETGN